MKKAVKLEGTILKKVQEPVLEFLPRFIGGGGFGDVSIGILRYMNSSEMTSMSVAVKEIQFGERVETNTNEPPKNVTTEENILNEIKILGECQHQDFVIEYLGFHKNENIYYLVTKRCLSIDLIRFFKLIAQRRRSELAMVLIVGIADALSNLNQLGYVHRDVKPANILLDNYGVPKLIDFGLARTITEAPIESMSGTDFYVAPEAYFQGPLLAAYDSWGLGMSALNFFTAKKSKKFYPMRWDRYVEYLARYKTSETDAKLMDGDFKDNPSVTYNHLNKHEELLLKLTKEQMLLVEPTNRPCCEDVKMTLKDYWNYWEHDDIRQSKAALMFRNHIGTYRIEDNASRVIESARSRESVSSYY